MSLLKANAVQLGQSVTATNNFTWYQPSTPDGTVRLGNGNSGSVTDLITLTSAGNLGIGTSSPGTKLEVNGNQIINYSGQSQSLLTVGGGSTSAAMNFRGSTGSAYAWQISSNSFVGSALEFTRSTAVGGTTFSTPSMLLDSSGNLGLGVTPSAWETNSKALQLSGGSVWGFSTSQINLLQNAYYNASGNLIYNNTAAASAYRQISGVHSWYTAPSGTAGNAISFTQAMTLDASGNLLIGKTITSSAVQGYVIGLDGSLAQTTNQTSIWNGLTTGKFFSIRNNSTEVGSIVINSGSVNFNTTSDQRLKENIVDAPSALSSVKAIKVRSFDWKSDGSHVDYGYIAQELLEIVPEAVSVPANPEEMMGVDFGKLTPRLVKAIQELSAELNLLKQKVNA